MAGHKVCGEWMLDDMVIDGTIKIETIRLVESHDMAEGDVLVASYPKTGTTWTQELIWLLYNECDIKKATSLSIEDRVPYIELTFEGRLSRFEKLLQRPKPHIMKTHLRAETFRKQIEAGKLKIVIVIRNPKDTLVSYYHFYRINEDLGNFKGSWHEFFELYKAKHLLYGDYFRWYSSWLQYLDRPNIKLVKYEDMKRRLPDVIKELSQFLGKPVSPGSIDDVIKHLGFESMSQNKMTNMVSNPRLDFKISPFMRKGMIGDWKNYFTDEQSELVDQAYKEMVERFGISLQFE